MPKDPIDRVGEYFIAIAKELDRQIERQEPRRVLVPAANDLYDILLRRDDDVGLHFPGNVRKTTQFLGTIRVVVGVLIRRQHPDAQPLYAAPKALKIGDAREDHGLHIRRL